MTQPYSKRLVCPSPPIRAQRPAPIEKNKFNLTAWSSQASSCCLDQKSRATTPPRSEPLSARTPQEALMLTRASTPRHGTPVHCA